MYFSIPDISEISAKASSNQQAYTLFNIHIDGIHHCSLRFSQLRKFNEDLRRVLPTVMENSELFPPRKLFTLTPKETEERRAQLEQYLRSIALNKYITSSSYFNEFFYHAQLETFYDASLDNNRKINLTICLLNNHEIIIENILMNDNKARLLDACALKMQIHQDFVHYFSLYLYEQKGNELNIIRVIYDFESPYLLLKEAKKHNEHSCIVLKKSYWNADCDLQLIDDRRARNLLFIQAQYEIQQSRDFYPGDIYQQLETLRENSLLKDYVLLARKSSYYGHVMIKQCSILYPPINGINEKLAKCILAIGNNEIICCFSRNEDKQKPDVSLKVTRIRCWKVTCVGQNMSISLEYLVKKDTLKWITIHTEQASLISTLLQDIVDEILATSEGPSSPEAQPVASPSSSSAATSESSTSKNSHGLAIRRESDLERLNNNDIFDRGGGDDEL